MAIAGRPPLIVMGMHRSGTSLVARVLQHAGVHLGTDTNVHDESDFFREQNKRIFQLAHADWDWPAGMQALLEDAETREALEEELRAACGGSGARGFLGWRRWLAARELGAQTDPWGWKDPRNTYTLPLWRRIFPEARVVNVYRDGVDVAASLVARERKRSGRLANPIRSSRCLHPERAFELWAEYVETSLQVTEDLGPRQVRDVRYEALMEKPETQVRELASFAGVELLESEVRAAAAEVDPGRNDVRREEPEWIELRRARSEHPLMQRLAYGDHP